MTSIKASIDIASTLYEEYMDDQCSICEKSNTQTLGGIQVAGSYKNIVITKCLVLNDTSKNSDVTIGDISKNIDYKIFNLPKNTIIKTTNYILYNNIYYDITKLNNATSKLCIVAQCEGIIK